MEPALLVLMAAAPVALGLAVALTWAVAGSRAGQRRFERDLAATRAELASLRDRLDQVDHRPAPTDAADRATVEGRAVECPDHVITTLSDHQASGAQGPLPVEEGRPSRREFASVAVTESVVRIAALAHGVRRALSPQSRNRIRFEMGREVKRSRKERRRAARQAGRHLDPDPAMSDPGTRRADEAA